MTDPGSGDRPSDDDSAVPDEDRDTSPEDPDVQRSTTLDAGVADDPPPTPDDRTDSDSGPDPQEVGYVEWVLNTDDPSIVVLRDVVSSVATVVLIGALLFAISGLWPPLVAVESGSMEPHMHRGDLVFVMDEHRFTPDQAAGDTGIVTYQAAREVDRENPDRQGYRSFGNYGNVIVYEQNGRASSPIIHRAHLYVEEGDRWVERADEDALGPDASCETVSSCPAPYDGFVTKGDANGGYDQADNQRISSVVKPEWVRGRAKARVPFMGHVRLFLGSIGTGPVSPGGGSVVPLPARLLAVVGVGAAAAYGTRQ